MTDDLAAIADVYRKAALDREPPAKAVARHLGVSIATAHRRLKKVREAGLLPEVAPGLVGSIGTHEPRTIRWFDGSETWLACRTCKTPWPCQEI